MFKECSKCEAEKSVKSFRNVSRSKDGYDWWCRNCRSDYETARRRRKGFTYKDKNRKTSKRRDHDVVEPFSLEAFLKELEGPSKALAG